MMITNQSTVSRWIWTNESGALSLIMDRVILRAGEGGSDGEAGGETGGAEYSRHQHPGRVAGLQHQEQGQPGQ